MNDLARLRTLVAFDIADSLRILRVDASAVALATADASTAAWQAVEVAVIASPVSDVTRHLRSATRDAARHMASGCSDLAAERMAFLRDDTMTVDEYAAEVAAEALAAGVSL